MSYEELTLAKLARTSKSNDDDAECACGFLVRYKYFNFIILAQDVTVL